MIVVDLNKIELAEVWSDLKPSIWFKAGYPLFEGVNARESSLLYFEIEPEHETGLHKHSAGEVLLVLDGTVEARVAMQKTRLPKGQLVLIPALVPHNVRNVGGKLVRCLGFFGNPTVVSTFEKVLQPVGKNEFGPVLGNPHHGEV